jgi:TPR repeat protein
MYPQLEMTETPNHYRNAVDFYRNKHYVNAIESFKLSNNSDSLCILGNFYYFGKHVKQDYEQAFRYYKLASEKGDVIALNNMGRCYSDGRGVKRDFAKAFNCYKQAYERDSNNPVFMCNLAYCYYHGEGVGRDYKKAVYYYKLASNKGDYYACERLNRMYKLNCPIMKNALIWLENGNT